MVLPAAGRASVVETYDRAERFVLDRLVSDLPSSRLRAIRQRLVLEASLTAWSDCRLAQYLAGHSQDVVERVAVAVQVEQGAESAAGT